jgi:hypothetical protein
VSAHPTLPSLRLISSLPQSARRRDECRGHRVGGPVRPGSQVGDQFDQSSGASASVGSNPHCFGRAYQPFFINVIGPESKVKQIFTPPIGVFSNLNVNHIPLLVQSLQILNFFLAQKEGTETLRCFSFK